MESAPFDAAVSSLVLCCVEDPGRAAAELFRVVRPGGQLLFYEQRPRIEPWPLIAST